ncbi:MAG: hypothetical protein AMXMBFR33_20710 [Candidatus Xenobia bacterium]
MAQGKSQTLERDNQVGPVDIREIAEQLLQAVSGQAFLQIGGRGSLPGDLSRQSEQGWQHRRFQICMFSKSEGLIDGPL